MNCEFSSKFYPVIETLPTKMPPKTVNEDFEFVSPGPADPVDGPNDQQFDQQFSNQQSEDLQPNYAQDPFEPEVSDAILKLTIRDQLVQYLTDASAYLNGKPFTEHAKEKMSQDKCNLMSELTNLTTSSSPGDLAADEPMLVFEVTWSFVAALVASLNTNLENLIDYSARRSIDNEMRLSLLNENQKMISALLNTPMRRILGNSSKKYNRILDMLRGSRSLSDSL